MTKKITFISIAIIAGIVLIVASMKLSRRFALQQNHVQTTAVKTTNSTVKNEVSLPKPAVEWSSIKSIDKFNFDEPLRGTSNPVYKNPFGLFDVYVLPYSQAMCRLYAKVDPQTRMILYAYLFIPFWKRDGKYSSEECKRIARWIENAYGVSVKYKNDGDFYIFSDANPKSSRRIYCERKNNTDSEQVGNAIVIKYYIRPNTNIKVQEGKDITSAYGITLGESANSSSRTINWGKNGVSQKPDFIADASVIVTSGVISDIKISSISFENNIDYLQKMLFAIRQSLEKKYEMTMEFNDTDKFTYKKNGRSISIVIMLDKFGDPNSFEVCYRFDEVYDKIEQKKQDEQHRQDAARKQQEKQSIDAATKLFGE